MVQELFPFLCVHNAEKAIQFCEEVFGAHERFRLADRSSRIGHAELEFGGATLMFADEFLEFAIRSARSVGATPATIPVHVTDADAVIAMAKEAGTTLDPFDHRWNIGHSIEEVSPTEMQARYTELLEGG